jgi:hypothetical protein
MRVNLSDRSRALHILSTATLLRSWALNYLGSIRAIYYLQSIELAVGLHTRSKVMRRGNSLAVHEYQAFLLFP